MADFVLQTGNKKLWPKSVTECDFLSLIVTFFATWFLSGKHCATPGLAILFLFISGF